MKFVVGRDALGEAVAFVSRALPSRPVVPLLSGLMVEAAADGLTLSCFDYEVSARIRVDAEVAEPGSALVPGRLLAEITRSLPARPAEFSRDGEMVSLICGQAEFGLVCLPAADYPALPGSPERAGVADGGVLAAAVGQVAAAASRDDTLPMLTAICLDITGEVMTLAATDRYRLAAREIPFAPADPSLRALALVPARFMTEAARTFEPGVPVSVAFGAEGSEHGADGRPAEGLVCFESESRRLTGRLIAGEFIRYRNRFGDDFGCQAELPAGPVIDAVRRAALVAERAGPVRLSFRPDRVVIEARAEGRARAAETVRAEFTGDEPVISFNPHYLLDGLTAAAAGEPAAVADRAPGGEQAGQPDVAAAGGRIRLQFNSPAKPALITWAAGAGEEEAGIGAGAGADGVPPFRYLLVPLRVPERA